MKKKPVVKYKKRYVDTLAGGYFVLERVTAKKRKPTNKVCPMCGRKGKR